MDHPDVEKLIKKVFCLLFVKFSLHIKNNVLQARRETRMEKRKKAMAKRKKEMDALNSVKSVCFK